MKLDEDSNIKGDMGGAISVTFKENANLNDFCAKNIQDYNPERLQAFALRVFYGKEIFITIYAADKDRATANTASGRKVPVKKFKLDRTVLMNLFPFLAECNFTLTTGDFPLEGMEVINK
ncbi:MAG: hypothetical protein ABIT08_07025 [Bacteroidia bacterium]